MEKEENAKRARRQTGIKKIDVLKTDIQVLSETPCNVYYEGLINCWKNSKPFLMITGLYFRSA